MIRLLLGALVAAAGVGACGGPPRAHDVVLVTVDTLRADHLSLYGYHRETSPELARWFGGGAIFERAYVTAASTPPSVVSILSGLLPQDHGVRLFYQRLPETTRLLTDYLPDDFVSAGFVSNAVLTDDALGLAGRFDHFDDFVDEREPFRVTYERSARRTTDAALRWLAERARSPQPLFLWVHYIDPHGPYRPPADRPRDFVHEGRVPLVPERIYSYQRDPELDDALEYVDRYDEEIAYADRELGRLLDGYAAHRPADRALLLFTADHGESMYERGLWFTHGFHVFEELVRVPLLVRGPGVTPGRRRDLVSAIDLVPTVLRAVGAPRPGSLPGLALQARPPAEERTVFAEAAHGHVQLRAAVRGDSKWLLALRSSSGVEMGRGFFDLRRDPGEVSPSAWPDADTAGDRMLALVARDPDRGGQPQARRDGKPVKHPRVDPRAGPDDLARLRALGYVE